MTRTRRAEQGLALASVLVAGTLVTATVAIALNLAGQRAHHAGLQQRRERSFQITEAGVAVVYEKLAQRLPPFDADPSNWPERDAAGRPTIVDKMITAVDGTPVTIRVTRIATNPDRYEIKTSSNF